MKAGAAVKRGGQSWCILRTSGSNTVALMRSLADAGFEVWTPIEQRERRAGKERKLVEQDLPITPSFVFARMDRLDDLIALSRSPALNYRVWDANLRRMVTKGHPHFSVFRDGDGFGMVYDTDLSALRTCEQAATEIAERRRRAGRKDEYREMLGAYSSGDTIKINDGPFQGLTGIVQTTAGKYLMVTMEGLGFPVKISPWHLPTVMLDAEGVAAEAA